MSRLHGDLAMCKARRGDTDFIPAAVGLRAMTDAVASAPAVTHLFVYGTLLRGDVRWHHLAPFVVDEGWDDAVAGRLFDTGNEYPAAIFDVRAQPPRTVFGRTHALLTTSLERCLAHLDEVEGVVGGAYRRVTVMTSSGTRAWAYEYGHGLELTEISSGSWADRITRGS